MDLEELVARHPVLRHVTEGGAWESIERLGLLSTTALVDRFEVPSSDRSRLESRPRPRSVELRHPEHGRAVIRDNSPLRLDILERFLDCSVDEWCRLLNRRVFFWATEHRLHNHLRARGHRGRPRDVITISTARLLERPSLGVTLCAFNSGSALYPNAPRRGPRTFFAGRDYPYDEVRRRRGRKDAVVEVCVDHELRDVTELVVAVERV